MAQPSLTPAVSEDKRKVVEENIIQTNLVIKSTLKAVLASSVRNSRII